MFNKVLWALDNQIEPRAFERLCTDVLSLEGYPDIVPLGGTNDGGRDAEIRIPNGSVTFFQYSLQKTWQGKLRKELKNLHKNGQVVDLYIFVTSQTITGRKQDSLRKEVQDNYGWTIQFYDREWLRNRLEIQYPHLATKYLGVNLTLNEFSLPIPENDLSLHKAVQNYLDNGDYEEASVQLKKSLVQDGEDIQIRYLLSYCQYHMSQYKEALLNILHVRESDGDDLRFVIAHGAILAEQGIQQNSRAALLKAKQIFESVESNGSDWIGLYNYGNVLSALGEYENAISAFENAINLNSQIAEIWTNLGNALSRIHKYDQSKSCYDKALEINPRLQQAIAGKAVLMLQIEENPKAALELFKRLEDLVEEGLDSWYDEFFWITLTYIELEDYTTSLKYANKGLDRYHQHGGLLNLKAEILSILWQEQDVYLGEALSYFEFLHDLGSASFPATVELAQIYLALNRGAEALSLLDTHISVSQSELDRMLNSADGMFDLQTRMLAIKHIAVYIRYGRTNDLSLEHYFSPLRKLGLDVPDELMEFAKFMFTAIFGVAYETISNAEKSERLQVLEGLHEPILKHFMCVAQFIYEELNSQVRHQNKEIKIALKTLFAEILLLQPVKFLGWIAGSLNVGSEAEVQNALEQNRKIYDHYLEAVANFILDDDS